MSHPARPAKHRSKNPAGRQPSPGRIRIVGGTWRGRQLSVHHAAGLRPTGERMRETLFNWLQGWTAGATVLDLCAGSGALGLEALSRGAASCTWVEENPTVAAALIQTQKHLSAPGSVVIASITTWLEQSARPFDLVFFDPPFDAQLWLPTLARLQQGWLHDHSRIYVEAPPDIVGIERGYHVLREKRIGQSVARLLSTH